MTSEASLPHGTGSANPSSGNGSREVEAVVPIPVESSQEYIHVLRDMLDLNKNLIVACNFAHHAAGSNSLAVNTWSEMFGVNAKGSAPPRIDVWIYSSVDEDDAGGDLHDDHDLSLLLQLSYVLVKKYKRCKVREVSALMTCSRD
jgi:hypothetical protein